MSLTTEEAGTTEGPKSARYVTVWLSLSGPIGGGIALAYAWFAKHDVSSAAAFGTVGVILGAIFGATTYLVFPSAVRCAQRISEAISSDRCQRALLPVCLVLLVLLLGLALESRVGRIW